MEDNQISIQSYEHDFRYTAYPHAFMRIIRPTLPANAQILYICLIDRMFGFHLPEGTPIRVSYKELRFQAGISSDQTVRVNMLLLEILGLIEHSKEGYTVNFAPLRMVEKWLRSLSQEEAYIRYLKHENKRQKEIECSTVIVEPSTITVETALQKMKRRSTVIVETLVRLWRSNPSHRAELQIVQNSLNLFLNKSLKPILLKQAELDLKKKELEFKFMNLDRTKRGAIVSLCNQAMNDPKTNFHQTDILALLEKEEE